MTVAKTARPLTGILNLAKPIGVTSHDVVDQIRRITGQRRVGHAGTLDPGAAGVLLVCLGAATRLSDQLMGGTKRYLATIRFGATSTTEDAAGVITPGQSIDHLTEEAIRGAIPAFLGAFEQIPPAFSAIKVAGQPLYRRARAGEAVTPPARMVQIERIDLVSWEPPDLTIDVVCAKGTYIRSLARDLGRALGCGGYLLGLIRTASGGFVLADSVSLDEVARAVRLGYVDRLLYPIEIAVADWPAAFLPSEEIAALRNGQIWRGPPAVSGTNARAYAAQTGRLAALLVYQEDPPGWHPSKVFPEDGIA